MNKTLIIFSLAIGSLAYSQSVFNGTAGAASQGLGWGQTDAAAVDFFTNLSSRPKKIHYLIKYTILYKLLKFTNVYENYKSLILRKKMKFF